MAYKPLLQKWLENNEYYARWHEQRNDKKYATEKSQAANILLVLFLGPARIVLRKPWLGFNDNCAESLGTVYNNRRNG